MPGDTVQQPQDTPKALPIGTTTQLDPNAVLAEMLANSRQASTAVGAMQAVGEDIKANMKKLTDKITGNGGGIEEGMEYRLLQVEKQHENCPGNLALAGLTEIKVNMADQFKVLNDKMDVIVKTSLLQKGEQIGAAKGDAAIQQAEAEKKDNLIVVKKSWFKDSLHWAAEHPKTVLSTLAGILGLGTGTLALNWHSALIWLKDLVTNLLGGAA